MNSSRNINPSILVAALSACIGLLTVGAPARAQDVSANTKCNETASKEINSLLDDKAFVGPLREFLAALNELIAIGKVELTERESIEVVVEDPDDGTIRRTESSSGKKRLRELAGEAAEKIAQLLGSEKQFNHFDGSWKNPVRRSTISFVLENSALVVSSKTQFATPDAAQTAAATFEAYFSFGRCRDRGQPDAVLFENSKPLVEDNQFLIVTHLPRASLADLLAKPLEETERVDETDSKP